MVWVRIDDHFDEHPKIASLSDSAVAVLVAGLAYCNRNLTDGFIPHMIGLGKLRFCDGNPQPILKELESAGIFHPTKGGWIVHDYLDYQPSKQRVMEERAASAKRMKGTRTRRKVAGIVAPQHEGVLQTSCTFPVPVPITKKKTLTVAPAPGLPLEAKPLTPHQAVIASYCWIFEREFHAKAMVNATEGKAAKDIAEGRTSEEAAWIPYEYFAYRTDKVDANRWYSLRNVLMDCAKVLARSSPTKHPLPQEILTLIGGPNGKGKEHVPDHHGTIAGSGGQADCQPGVMPAPTERNGIA